jgi:20S proteasome subunit alpha 2
MLRKQEPPRVQLACSFFRPFFHASLSFPGRTDRYSFSLTTFSPSGKLVQIEYALNAVNAGSTCVGIKATNGVVIATEKKLPFLMDQDSFEKVTRLTADVGMVYAGMGPDSRVLLAKGRKSAEKYKLTYGESMPVSQLVKDVAGTMQEYTQSGGVRPFGCSLLVAGFDEDGPKLYQVDPSGSYWAWKASALGKNGVNARTFLEKRYKEEDDIEDAVQLAILTLKEGFDGEITADNIEIGISSLGAFRKLTAAEIAEYLAQGR